MKAITVLQPWASLIAMGELVKAHETRSWATQYTGPLAIHAAIRFDLPQRQYVEHANHILGMANMPLLPRKLPLGHIVAVAKRVTCNGYGAQAPYHILDKAFGDFGAGRFAWRLHDVQQLPDPIRWQGLQRLWHVPAHVEERIREQLEQGHKTKPTPTLNAVSMSDEQLHDLLCTLETGVCYDPIQPQVVHQITKEEKKVMSDMAIVAVSLRGKFYSGGMVYTVAHDKLWRSLPL